jgi:hypothetical protein
MSRKVAVIWHAVNMTVAGVLYFFFVLPRWPELSGDIPDTGGYRLLVTVLRIVTGALLGLGALPVVFTWLRTRRPEFGTPQLALRLRLCSIVLHVLGGVMVVGTAISEIWLSLDDFGRWLFGIYGAAAAICLLAVFAFYLAFIAELPPPPPKPKKQKKDKKEKETQRRRRRRRRRDGEPTDESAEAAEQDEEEAEEDLVPVAAKEAEPDDEAEKTWGDEVEEKPRKTVTIKKTVTADSEKVDEAEETTEAEEPATEDETPAPEDTVASEPARGGVRNRRPRGKVRSSRRRQKSSGVAVED